MSSVFGIALSGLLAQEKRLSVSASNVANVQSTGLRSDDPAPQPEAFVPHRTALASDGAGGVRATAVPISPASVPVFEPGAPDADSEGIAARPNVSLERELVEQMQALRSFQANLKVIETENTRLGALLDVIS